LCTVCELPVAFLHLTVPVSSTCHATPLLLRFLADVLHTPPRTTYALCTHAAISSRYDAFFKIVPAFRTHNSVPFCTLAIPSVLAEGLALHLPDVPPFLLSMVCGRPYTYRRRLFACHLSASFARHAPLRLRGTASSGPCHHLPFST